MKFTATRLPEVVLIEPTVFGDDRGWFMETFSAPKFAQGLASLGLPAPRPFVQENESASRRGVLRGLHYQLPPHAQGKLVRVVQGAVFDVAVDIRRGSPSFGRWVGFVLSGSNFRQLWIPPGFAHGFCVLSERVHVEYKCTEFYDREDEIAIAWNDVQIGIEWPVRDPILSKRDASARPLAELAALLER